MKNFKIINLFIFLFVINLSITFLYKNDLFATFINGVLQTNDKNFLPQKQRSLAEGGSPGEGTSSGLRDVEEHGGIDLSSFINMIFLIGKQACRKMVEAMPGGSAGTSASARAASSGDLVLYQRHFNRSCRLYGVKVPFHIVTHFHEMFKEIISQTDITVPLKDILKDIEKAMEDDFDCAKLLIMKYIEEKSSERRDIMLSFNFIRGFLEDERSRYRGASVRFHRNTGQFILLCKDLMEVLSQSGLISI